ncbi:MAG: hypothetical protein WCD13_05305 [Pseudolabrys sp.]
MRGRPDIRYNGYVGVNLSQLGQRPVNIAPLALQHLDLVNTLRAVDRLGAAVRTRGQRISVARPLCCGASKPLLW